MIDIEQFPSRLGPIDDMFARSDYVLGAPVGILCVWYFDERVSGDTLVRIHRDLAEGPLNRVVEKARVPGARDRWAKPAEPPAFSFETEPLAPGRMHEWIDQQGRGPLSILHGPAWRLAATSVEGGGTAVALVAHHALTDVLGLFGAWTAAVRGERRGTALCSGASDRGMLADLLDSARQWRALVFGAVKLVRSVRQTLKRTGWADRESSAGPAILTTADLDHAPTASKTFVPHIVFLEFSSEEFQRAAAARGGTANSLLAGIGLRLLAASGVVPEGSTVRVSQQMSKQPEGQICGNNSLEVVIVEEVSDAIYHDLRPIRAKSKEAFRSADADASDSLLLLQMIPSWILKRASRAISVPHPCLCSTVRFKVPDEALEIDGKRARSLYMKLVVPKEEDADRWRRLNSPIYVGGIDIGDVVLLAFEGRNPECHSADRETFLSLVVEECARWGIEPVRVL